MAEKFVYDHPINHMFPGWKAKIQGRTTQCSERFIVNLECMMPCNKSRVTIPFHMSVRFDQGCIVRNTRNGTTEYDWGQEERCGGMPIVKGDCFTIELECKLHVISIYINGCHFSDYQHRLPFNTINFLTVEREAEICDVSFSGTPEKCCCNHKLN